MNGLPEYWANKTGTELLNRLNAKIDAYYEWLLVSGRLARWKIAYDTYYGQRGNHNSSWVTAAGEQQELSFLMSNEYRNLIQHLLVMSTSTRPTVECVAANADFKSRAQAMLGNGVLEHYFRERKVERVIKAALEISLITDISWCFPVWDMSMGEAVAVDPDSGTTIREGDVKAITRTGLDVIFDYSRLDPDSDQEWIIVRDSVNKYDAAAMLPEKKNEILAIERDFTKDSLYRFGDVFEIQSSESDLIDKHTFFHAKTPSCPEGKMVIWYGTSVEGFNGPLPFRKIPAARCVPTEKILSSMGYSNANDLLGLQDVIDGCISAATTNVMNFGVNNLWSPNKSTIDFDQIAQGLNVIKSDVKPELLDFAQLGSGTIELMKFLIDRMQTISGVNSVARGDTGGKDLSGAAMALLQSMAIQFNNGLQSAYSQLIEDVGTQIICQLQDFATTERTAMIAGKNNRFMLEAFHSGRLDKISRVYVNQSNPLRNTTSGRLTIAKELLTAGLLKHPDEYIQVLETGKLEPAVDDSNIEQMAIQAENESLAEGAPVKAVWTDDHQRHIGGHKMAISDPEARMDGDLVQRVLLHIQEHMGLMQQPLPIMDPMALGGGAPQPGQSSQKALPPGQTGAPEVSDTNPQDGNMPNQPGMPTNPLSGGEWNPETGGLPSEGMTG